MGRGVIFILLAAGLLFWFIRRRDPQPETVVVGDSILDKQPAIISAPVTALPVVTPALPTTIPQFPVFGVPTYQYGAPGIMPPPMISPEGFTKVPEGFVSKTHWETIKPVPYAQYKDPSLLPTRTRSYIFKG